MKKAKDGVSPIIRKKRKGRLDDAGCYIRSNGKRIYYKLGAWGDPNVDREYLKLLNEYHNPAVAIRPEGDIPTMEYLFLKFLKVPKHRKDYAVFNNYCRVVKLFLRFRPGLRCDKFHQDDYDNFRTFLIDYAKLHEDWEDVEKDGKTVRVKIKRKQWSLNYVCKLLKLFRTILNWGDIFDLVPERTLKKIKLIKDPEDGEYPELVERPPVEDVPDWVVAKTLPFMLPMVADMIRLARDNAMRPTEICQLRAGDIDTTGKHWKTVLRKHKTQRYGICRIIVFGPASTSILKNRIAGKAPDDYLFSPRDAMRERWEQQAASRQTKKTPSAMARDAGRADGKFDRFKDHYTPQTLLRSIKNALEKAARHGIQIPHWFTYQLRHSGITAAVLSYGMDAARVIASHKSLRMTEHYFHGEEEAAERIADQRSGIWWEEAEEK